jgi:acyl-CoA thioesterase-1
MMGDDAMRVLGGPLKQLMAALIVFSATTIAMTIASAAKAQIVAFGASNVAGTSVGQGEAYPAQLEVLLKAKGYNVSIANAGRYGSTTSDMLSRLDAVIPPGTTVVILETSGPLLNNEINNISPAQGRTDVAAINAALKARGVKVIPEPSIDNKPRYKRDSGKYFTLEGHQLVAARLLPKVIEALGAPPSPQ